FIAADIAEALTRQPENDPDDWDRHPRSIWEDDHGDPWRNAQRPYDVFLERAVPNLAVGSYVLFQRAAVHESFAIDEVGDETLSAFSLTGRATGLSLSDTTGKESNVFLPRRTAVHVQSEPLALAPIPIGELIEDRGSDPSAAPAGAGAIELDRMMVGLAV